MGQPRSDSAGPLERYEALTGATYDIAAELQIVLRLLAECPGIIRIPRAPLSSDGSNPSACRVQSLEWLYLEIH
jgi:hypothetical protein